MEQEQILESTHEQVREHLIEELRENLLGPASVDEIITDPPTIHYLTGVLYPDEVEISPDQDDEASEAPLADDDVDPGTLMASAFNPSAMGFTFTVIT